MATAPRAALAGARAWIASRRLDLRHAKRGAQVAQVERVDADGARALGDDDRFERALLNAVLA
jgi:hypothetical protein